MYVDIVFTGGPELDSALKALGSEVAGKLGAESVLAGAEVIAKYAEDRAPERPGGGALKRSIRVAQEKKLVRGERTAYIAATVFYARFVEYGTVRATAKPFMRPALDTGGQGAVDEVVEVLSEGIARETSKYGGGATRAARFSGQGQYRTGLLRGGVF